MRKYVFIASAGFTTLALMSYMSLLPFGNPVGYLILSGIHLTYYWAITSMGKSPQDAQSKVIGQNRKKRLPNKIIPDSTGTTEYPNQTMSDVLKALNQLGYARRTSHELIKVVQKNYPQLKNPNEIVKACIKSSVAQ